MPQIRPTLKLFMLTLACGAPACDDGDDVNARDGAADATAAAGDAGGDAGAARAVALKFEGRIGAERFDCSRTYSGVGAAASTIEPLDFRLYVHDVRLVRADATEVPLALDQDGVWQHQGLALLDFENRSGSCANGTTGVNETIRGTAPAGTYTGVKFKVGVPFALNHADASLAPSPLNLTTLFWSWAGGYKFLRADLRLGRGATDAGAGDAGGPDAAAASGHGGGAGVFNIHVGSTACVGDPTAGTSVSACGNPNRAEVSLSGLDLDAGAIVVDLAALVAGTALDVNRAGAPGCMSETTDPECAEIFTRLGVDLGTGQPLDTQVFFRKK